MTPSEHLLDYLADLGGGLDPAGEPVPEGTGDLPGPAVDEILLRHEVEEGADGMVSRRLAGVGRSRGKGDGVPNVSEVSGLEVHVLGEGHGVEVDDIGVVNVWEVLSHFAVLAPEVEHLPPRA